MKFSMAWLEGGTTGNRDRIPILFLKGFLLGVPILVLKIGDMQDLPLLFPEQLWTERLALK